jgi:hypothetical protein
VTTSDDLSKRFNSAGDKQYITRGSIYIIYRVLIWVEKTQHRRNIDAIVHAALGLSLEDNGDGSPSASVSDN